MEKMRKPSKVIATYTRDGDMVTEERTFVLSHEELAIIQTALEFASDNEKAKNVLKLIAANADARIIVTHKLWF